MSLADLNSLSLSSLRPDWQNPRFPPAAVDGFADDLDVYAYIDRKFDSVSVAESIARHGFFPTEPLIAIREDSGSYVVLEGNRRLTALKGLVSESVRTRMSDPRWKSLPAPADVAMTEETEVPVLIAATRGDVAPILGYRHVTGITPWDPFQQARYVASLIDDQENPLPATKVAELIGRDVSEVRAFYRNYSIVEQAREEFDIPDPDRMTDEFGVWTRAMTSTGIRDYIQAPPPRDVAEGEYPLPDDSKERLAKTVTWLFGAPRSEADRQNSRQSSEGRVISDSRQLTKLGKVLSTADGRAALESGADLKVAERASLNPAKRFTEALSSASSHLQVALQNATPELVADSAQEIRDIKTTIERIEASQ